ncbi:Helix-turn-helix domain-containing protein [Nakamurella panacisegetis]|uniref:Helix-turn-helix domain-containing protein n=1 Tax=Nakamurella panacisegetis TaxID=1090615 RepID=A0A1H0LMC0_9ACTN|nr:helix-turn-helix transcriptional regulator [Nakamurella panacisegetis]SDO69399.1 Helix-turn-helix domain-containing protein [Nakamurella panacisegetis]
MRATELAEFLRRRREALRPEDVGLVTGSRRRVVGMRREEVAAQVGMSVNYYTRLEQGRGPQPSISMLGAIARAMRLTNDERDYLYRVAGHAAPDRALESAHVAPGLLRVLDRLHDTPALILSPLLETLVANDMAIALFGDHTARTGLDRYDVYRWFTDPAAREVYPAADHERQSRAVVANLRVAYGQMGPRSRAAEIVRVLQNRSPQFAALWDRHEVARRFEDHKVLIHPQLGPLELDCQALFTEDGAQTLLTLTAAPRSAASEQLALLAVVGAQPF